MASFDFTVLELLQIVSQELSFLFFEISKSVPSFFGYNLGSFNVRAISKKETLFAHPDDLSTP